MDELTTPLWAFLAAEPVGVLATMRADGSVRQSLVYHVLDGERVLISTTGARAKSRDVRRSGWASYCVFAHVRPFPSVTIEGPARIRTDDVGAATTRLMEKISGNPIAVQLTDEQCAEMDRVILEITVERVYGVSFLETR